MIFKERITTAILCLTVLCSSNAFALGNGGGESMVKNEMSKASFWADRAIPDKDAIMLTYDEIDELNKKNIASKDTYTYNMEDILSSYDAKALRAELEKMQIPERDLYIEGKLIDKDEYYGKIIKAISKTGFENKQCNPIYAVVTSYAEIMAIPTDDYIGYSPADSDSEMTESAMLIGEPFIIKQKCSYDGKTFYYGNSKNVDGWVNAENVAICQSREEWLDSWKVETSANDFLVVLQDKLTLEKSMTDKRISKKELQLGNVLKLVPKEEIPKSIDGRGTWNNYVVYLPTRDDDGNYVKAMAMIPEHNNVSIGYPELTQENLIKVAYSCLGNRYGWGGMLEAMDCSAYTERIYRCFGLLIGRNTSWQAQTPEISVDFSKLDSKSKAKFISTLPIGSLVFFSGHITMYVGTENMINYTISDTGSVSDSQGDVEINSIYSVILTPLTVRRRNETTWLDNVTVSVVPSGEKVTRGMLASMLYNMEGMPEGTDHINEKAVDWVIKNGLIAGISEDNFGGEETLNKGQVASILYRYMKSFLGAEESEDRIMPKNAEEISPWLTEGIAFSINRGIMTVDEENNFDWQENVTRVDLSKMLVTALTPINADVE